MSILSEYHFKKQVSYFLYRVSMQRTDNMDFAIFRTPLLHCIQELMKLTLLQSMLLGKEDLASGQGTGIFNWSSDHFGADAKTKDQLRDSNFLFSIKYLPNTNTNRPHRQQNCHPQLWSHPQPLLSCSKVLEEWISHLILSPSRTE